MEETLSSSPIATWKQNEAHVRMRKMTQMLIRNIRDNVNRSWLVIDGRFEKNFHLVS